jgi:hypothetical protein
VTLRGSAVVTSECTLRISFRSDAHLEAVTKVAPRILMPKVRCLLEVAPSLIAIDGVANASQEAVPEIKNRICALLLGSSFIPFSSHEQISFDRNSKLVEAASVALCDCAPGPCSHGVPVHEPR